MKRCNRNVWIILLAFGLVFCVAAGINWVIKSRQIPEPISIERVDTIQELKLVVGGIVALKRDEAVDLEGRWGTNLNEDGFAEQSFEMASARIGLKWEPAILNFDDAGNWVDSRNNLINVMFFGNSTKMYEESEIRNLAQRYRAAAWSIGRNEINENGAGDDIFVGLTRDGSWEFERYDSPWWRFWR